MNKKLYKNIKKFYQYYDLSKSKVTFTKADMYDHDALMTAYEAMWRTLDYYDHPTTCKFLTNLYDELGDYLHHIPAQPKYTYKPFIKTASVILAAITIFTIGMHIGRQHTIRNVQLHSITENGYELQFGNDIHYYK